MAIVSVFVRRRLARDIAQTRNAQTRTHHHFVTTSHNFYAWQQGFSYVNCVQFAHESCIRCLRPTYLNDEDFLKLQIFLLKNPEAGTVIEGSGGLRKLRHGDPKRGKGKRGGLRVIYYWWNGGHQFWLFTLYDKDEMEDLSVSKRNALKNLLKSELEARK